MSYDIVNQRRGEEDNLERFINEILIDGSHYYCCLLARKKWSAELQEMGVKADLGQLKRFTATNKTLISKLYQLEICEDGYEIDGMPIPQDALGVYINPNPIDNRKATFHLFKSLTNRIERDEFDFSLHHETYTALQTNSKKLYFDVDVDIDEAELKKPTARELVFTAFIPSINQNCIRRIDTRGGFHILVELSKIDKQYQNTWYQSFSNLKAKSFTKDIMMNSNGLVPIPGCCQGGFVPKLI